ncbi:MAG: hypothetical protein E6J39_10440 [Chloroflexi bacterium]|nr:MAG: hypothetical protein E6J39_10440 [Chloroflexota bacterium]
MSPTLMERYVSAAQKISRMAVGGPVPAPSVDTFRVAEDVSQDDRLDGLPFGTRGGTRVRYRFPSDGEYVIQARLSRLGISGGATEDIPRFADSHDLEISVDGRRVALFTLAGETLAPGTREDAYQQHREHLDADWKVRIPIKAGVQEVTAAFLQKSAALNETARLPFLRPYLGSGGDLRYRPYLDERSWRYGKSPTDLRVQGGGFGQPILCPNHPCGPGPARVSASGDRRGPQAVDGVL